MAVDMVDAEMTAGQAAAGGLPAGLARVVWRASPAQLVIPAWPG